MNHINSDILKGDISSIFFKDDLDDKIANLEKKLMKISQKRPS
jgi:hypothetical protein